MANPVTMDWAYEKMWSPTHAIGRYDRISSSLWRPSNAAAFRAVTLRFRWESIAPFGTPVVLDHREPGLRVVEDVLHLLLDRVLVDRDRHAAEGPGGHDGPVELRAVVADDGGLVATGEAERREAEGDQPSLVEVVAPGVGLPDPVVFLTDCDPGCEALGVVSDELRKRVTVGSERLPVQFASSTSRVVSPLQEGGIRVARV